MHFIAPTFAAVVVAVYVALVPSTVRAGITAFSGDACNGAVGLDVACDGSCISFDGRHSFRVDSGTGDHCVTMYVDGGCPSGGQKFFFTNEDGLH